MSEYRVRFEIDIYADSPRKAAELALNWLRDEIPAEGWEFEVIEEYCDHLSKTHKVTVGVFEDDEN